MVTKLILNKIIFQKQSKDGYNYDQAVDNDISEQQLLPDVKDPSLWIVKCLIGTERECAMKLMRKYLAVQNKELIAEANVCCTW